MKAISKRELNQQTDQVLAAIELGDSVLVTEYGVARWRIEAVDAASDPVVRLRRDGRIVPAKAEPSPWPEATGEARHTPAEVDALFADSRGEH